MFKTSEKQLVRDNNIRVAFHTPPNISSLTKITPSNIKPPTIITQPEFVTTSKYAAYHQQMGHIAPNLISVSSRQKKRLIENSNLPTMELKNKRLFLVIDMSKQKKQKQNLKKQRLT